MRHLLPALLFLLAGAAAAAAGIVTLAALAAATIMFASGVAADEVLGSVLTVVPIAMMISVGAMGDILPLLAPPAALVGGSLWMLAVRRERLRKRRAWAAAGALFGCCVFAAALTGALGWIGAVLADLGLSNRLLIADFVLAGAAAGLAFRMTMAPLSLLTGDESDLIWAGDAGSPGA